MVEPIKEQTIEKISVRVFDTKENLGIAAADHVAKAIHQIIEQKGEARIIFATGASQFEFLSELIKLDVQWNKIDAFHLDEYVGLSDTHPASFRKYLKERLFEKVNPRSVEYLNGEVQNLDEECQRYTDLLLKKPIDLACIGIGENGHIAFNDPPVADFNDPKWVKVVELDQDCRQQQFGEGWFPTIDDVPKEALTLTVPSIIKCNRISCVVPDERKANAVKNALTSEVATSCPATILRTHSNCILWLDKAAASLIL
jgi:glucosamine-6-phosphate deaminase